MTTDPSSSTPLDPSTPPAGDQAGQQPAPTDQGHEPDAGDQGQDQAPAPTEPDGASGAAGVGDLVEWEGSDPNTGTARLHLGLVVETWTEPVTGEDGQSREVELARVVQLPDAGVVELDNLTPRS